MAYDFPGAGNLIYGERDAHDSSVWCRILDQEDRTMVEVLLPSDPELMDRARREVAVRRILTDVLLMKLR